MSKIGTVTPVRHKRDGISAVIGMYEKKSAQARSDLAHVTSAIRIFEASGIPIFDLGNGVAATHEQLARGSPLLVALSTPMDNATSMADVLLWSMRLSREHQRCLRNTQ